MEEKWKAPLGKAPDITIFTLEVTAKGQGRILLTLNRDSGGPTSNEDVGSYRGLEDPTALDNDEKFYLEHHVPHENIRSYEDGFDSPYDDECVPVKHKGYNLEVVTGREDLDAVGKVFAEKVSIAYGRERSTQQALGLTGGWDSAAIEANFVHGTKRTWGWKLIAHTENYTSDSIDSSFRVTVNDIVSIEEGDPQDPACVECENCDEFVHNKDDHYLGLCPIDDSVDGCGKKRWSCETSKQLAWHQIRDCYNSVTVPLPLAGGPTEFCPERFRHCRNSECDFRIKRKRGHSDGTQSNSPSGVANLTAESHLIDEPPAMHVCGVHESWQSGDHAWGTFLCGDATHVGYLCQVSSDHSTLISGYSGSFYECQPHQTFACGHTDLTANASTHVQAQCPSTSAGGVRCTHTYWACLHPAGGSSHNHTYMSACGACSVSYDPSNSTENNNHRTRTCRWCSQTWQKCVSGAPQCLVKTNRKCWAID